ncbi:protein RALF-like 9 [Raphanus sativus]|uniref:Protein RALF-like 9 n=1 Tax=Raphanus sativus TaxID=3726 RepID=A0A6J0LYL1_RAPSA|nr:protein RALF-like 9 [Raphanus sativus]
MGISKTIKVIFSMALVVFLALAATKIEARYIDYGALHHGDPSFGCSKLHPQFCKKQEANPYARGCETIERCDRGQKK